MKTLNGTPKHACSALESVANDELCRVMQQVDAVISQSTQEVDRLTKHIHGLEDCLRQYVSDSSGEMLFLWRQLQAAIDHTHPVLLYLSVCDVVLLITLLYS